MSILTDISENLQRGKAKVVKELVQQAIDSLSFRWNHQELLSSAAPPQELAENRRNEKRL